MEPRFKDKTVVVTGAANGIGLACAYRFAAEGAKVVLCDLDDAAGKQAADAVAKDAAGRGAGEASFVRCDVGDKAQVLTLIDAAMAAHGRLDVLVNNAAIVHKSDFLEIEEPDFDRVLRVNLKGAFLVGQAAARVMAKQGGGAIVNMSSINGVFALPDQVPYTVSKHALNGLTRVMALSLIRHGIRVNAVGPGSIATRMLQGVLSDEDAMARMLTRTPAGRVGEPREIAALVAYLASDDASYVVGQTVYADGGRLPLNYFAS